MNELGSTNDMMDNSTRNNSVHFNPLMGTLKPQSNGPL